MSDLEYPGAPARRENASAKHPRNASIERCLFGITLCSNGDEGGVKIEFCRNVML